MEKMSCERARKALVGKKTDCIPLFDMPSHPGLVEKLTGINIFSEPSKAIARAVHMLDVDMLMCSIPDRATGSNLSTPNLYGLNATEWRHKGATRQDIFSYDPSKNRKDAACLNEAECVQQFQAQIDRDRSLVADTTLPIGYTFTTCIHYAAEDLDWEEFLIACSAEEEKVSVLLDRFQTASEKIIRAWARTDIEVMLTHDDIAMSTGTVQSPAWIRKHLIPRYRKIIRPLKDRGIPVLFMTDGDFSAAAKDLVEIGADGFFLDTPCVDLEELVSQCGPDLIYFTGPSPSTMTVGTPDDVRAEVARLAEIGRYLLRFFFHMPGGYPHNMPVENVMAFYEACREYGQR